MIPDDEETDPVIDFSWFYFIGRTKLGLSYHETGRITITLFNKLYRHYKNAFDLEILLQRSGKTFEDVHKMAEAAEDWF